MAAKSKLVNLDAMIKREDFAATNTTEPPGFENVNTISIRDFTAGALIGPSLRKPDFQRETNHWAPEDVASLIECFVNGDLIPSVILWQSQTYLFVIDGGHRLSALRAWIEDDYGDGPISQSYFGYNISDEQKGNAERTRALVNKRIGSWKHHESRVSVDLSVEERKKINTIVSRGLPIQWVKGDADKAESSFFKINTKGTPLDDIEETLLRNRRKPIAIAARAIIRAGKGHRYWSSFPAEFAQKIEDMAKELHILLFDPEIKNVVKTLDLPLGGPKGVRDALQVLIDVISVANDGIETGIKKAGSKITVNGPDDGNGEATVSTLTKVLKLIKRITGNDSGSLGLHPAVYFYGVTGRHSGPMFMGTLGLISEKLRNNDGLFFRVFSENRESIENTLITHKELISTILQKQISGRRNLTYHDILAGIVNGHKESNLVNEEYIVKQSGIGGRILLGAARQVGVDFSSDDKNQAFIKAALSSSLKCSICSGYLDASKSVSYDHVVRKQDGGKGGADNCALTHPYCNQSVKN